MKLQIIQSQLFDNYLLKVPNTLKLKFDLLKDAELSTDTFSFYTSVASVFSSKIEGENIELDNYIKHKRDGIAFLPDYTKKLMIYTMHIHLQKPICSIKKMFLSFINY